MLLTSNMYCVVMFTFESFPWFSGVEIIYRRFFVWLFSFSQFLSLSSFTCLAFDLSFFDMSLIIKLLKCSHLIFSLFVSLFLFSFFYLVVNVQTCVLSDVALVLFFSLFSSKGCFFVLNPRPEILKRPKFFSLCPKVVVFISLFLTLFSRSFAFSCWY